MFIEQMMCLLIEQMLSRATGPSHITFGMGWALGSDLLVSPCWCTNSPSPYPLSS